MVVRVLDALHDIFAAWCDFASWRDDWRKTWSPASYFLAVAMLLAFIVLLYLYGRDVLEFLAGARSADR
jgi:hypothetical protein